MNPLIGAALISGGSSLFGGLFGGLLGRSGQKEANRFNSQSVRETNASNERIAEQNRQWNFEQWQREAEFSQQQWQKNAEYNTPLAQRQRLEHAGLNPFLQGLQTGGVQAQTPSANASPLPQMQAPQMQSEGTALQMGIQTMADGIRQSALQVLQASQQGRLIDAEVEFKRAQTARQLLENEYLPKSMKADIAKNESDAVLSRARALESEFNVSYLKDMQPLQKEELASKILLNSNNASFLEISSQIKDYELKHLAPLQREQLMATILNIGASTSYLYANARLSEADLKLTLTEIFTEQLRAHSIELDNKVKMRVVNDMVKSIKANARGAELQNERTEQDIHYMPQKNAREWIGAAANVMETAVDTYATGGKGKYVRSLTRELGEGYGRKFRR